MPTMPMRVDPYARPPAKLSKTGRMFALVFALHVGLVLLGQSLWQADVPKPVRDVVTAALLPMFQDAPEPIPVPPTPKPTPVLPLQAPEPVKAAPVVPIVPAPQPLPALTSQTPVPASQAPSALPAIAAAPFSPVAPAVATPVPAIPPATILPPAVAAAVPARPAVLVPPSRVAASCDKPRYPPASARLREEGAVSLKFLINENGQVLSGSVEKSSGYKRLDDAALAGLSLCKFKPATVGGVPRQDWSAIRYVWQLED